MATPSETPAVAGPAAEATPAPAAAAAAAPAPAVAAGEATAAAAPADIDNRILDQVEFYFGDSNLPHDKHLSGLMKENKEGWVSIAHIATFKRLQQLTKDPAVVVNALRKSKSLLQVSEDGTKVRRVEPLPTNTDNTARTVYVKGFPVEASLDSIRDFFRTIGDIRCVRMRHTKDKAKTFKGSVFAEFATEDEAKRVAASQLKLPSSDTSLITHTKAEYVAKKIAEGKTEEKPSKKKGTKRGRDEKDGDAKEGESKEEEKAEAKVIVPDLIISIDGIPAGSSREDLQAFITEAGAKVKYTDFSRGETKAFIRLEEPGDGTGAKLATATVAALVEAKTQLAGVTPELKALTGEEEKEYWTKVWSRQYDSKRGRARGGGRGRGGRGRGRGGKGDRGRGGKGKKQKTSE